ncbi:uncharacterized protein LOC126252447 [Schistocerca nitens]|uniref:uncharacterized protein LOC126252447 n=1 Tax=Schistocerca nitens TaxID=7011 RepID=UPI0021198AD4|nr:uncharacterized protein LOC126252447 [Schistocerca nitens]
MGAAVVFIFQQRLFPLVLGGRAGGATSSAKSFLVAGGAGSESCFRRPSPFEEGADLYRHLRGHAHNGLSYRRNRERVHVRGGGGSRNVSPLARLAGQQLAELRKLKAHLVHLSPKCSLSSAMADLRADSPEEEEAAARVGQRAAAERPLRRLVRLAAWLTLLYLLPLGPRGAALNSTDAGGADDDDVAWTPLTAPLTYIISLDRVLGRWYVVEEWGPSHVLDYTIYDWFDFSLDENGILTVEWFTKPEEGYVITPAAAIETEFPATPEFDDELADEKMAVFGYTVVDLSPDERFLSVAVCAGRSSNCTVLVLARDVADADNFSALVGVHQRIGAAQRGFVEVVLQRGSRAPESTAHLPCSYNPSRGRLQCSF